MFDYYAFINYNLICMHTPYAKAKFFGKLKILWGYYTLRKYNKILFKNYINCLIVSNKNQIYISKFIKFSWILLRNVYIYIYIYIYIIKIERKWKIIDKIKL